MIEAIDKLVVLILKVSLPSPPSIAPLMLALILNISLPPLPLISDVTSNVRSNVSIALPPLSFAKLVNLEIVVVVPPSVE